MESGNKKMWDGFVKNYQNSMKTLFQRKKSSLGDEDSPSSPKPIPQLSPLANSVVSRCSKILKIPTEELQHHFDIELPEGVKQLFTYARNFIEFCSFQALQQVSRRPDYLSDPDFYQLTYDMMLAWEAPSVECEQQAKENTPSSHEEADDDEGWSLFYSSPTNLAVQVDDKKTVGREAFARIAPVCAAVADIITVHNLFDALTRSSGQRLHFLIYEKYLRSLDKVIKAAKSSTGSSVSSLQLQDGEIILDVDGTVPTQPVLQHIGLTAWPGRLTLTNFSLYFESLGVGLYEKAIEYDLSRDNKQVIKPELTGPLGARLFDKGVMYKSSTVVEPVCFEFPEFKGNSRRVFMLDISLEILLAHMFIRKNNFKDLQPSEVLARAALGIFRYRAVREAFHFFSSQYKTLLTFNLAERIPGGDVVLETLAGYLVLLNPKASPRKDKQSKMESPVSLLTLHHLGFRVQKKDNNLDSDVLIGGDIRIGEINPFEVAVKQSVTNTHRVEAAQATVDQVKVEGIDMNLAVMQGLLFPAIALNARLQHLQSWKDPFKSSVFLGFISDAILRGWIGYMVASVFLIPAGFMIWRRYTGKGKPLEAFRIKSPPNKNAVEQLLVLQESISHVEALIQDGNIILLKLRALLFAALPQATDMVAVSLAVVALMIAFMPLRFLILLAFLEWFTRELPFRRESADKLLRRLREWWVRIPAAPVQLVKLEDKKRK